MNIGAFLKEREPEIADKWLNLVLASYPPDTVAFLKRKKDRFENPVGNILRDGLEGLFRGLLKEEAGDEDGHLENILKIRALQDSSASVAVAFVLQLKGIIREELKEVGEEDIYDLLLFEDKIDRIALKAFDVFMKNREKLYEIKANEVRNMTFRLLERVNALPGEEKPAPEAGNGEK